jgi:hypothetical protein
MKTEERIKELEARFQAELAELKKELKPELVEGDIYYFENGTNKWIADFKRLNGREFYYNWLVPVSDNFNNVNQDNDWISIDNTRDFRPATREEVSNVLKTHKKN